MPVVFIIYLTCSQLQPKTLRSILYLTISQKMQYNERIFVYTAFLMLYAFVRTSETAY